MEGDGPTGGRKKHVGLTLCSADRYALDLVNAAVLGIDPASIPTVRQSIARGLCPASLAQVQLLGDRDALTQAGTVFAAPLQTDGFFFSISGAAAPGRQKGHPMAAAAAVPFAGRIVSAAANAPKAALPTPSRYWNAKQ